MNQLEMAKHISQRVPLLKKRDEPDWKKAERLRKQFVTDYPIAQIGRLSIDEYVIGKGSANRSFCYRLERELDSLGRILGARAHKFGVYYGKTKRDVTMKYRFAQHWGGSVKDAFKAVKQSIVNLLQAAARDDMATIRGSTVSPMFKGKLLFIYEPDRFAPIYAKPHLEHFLTELNIKGRFESEADMQRALMDYRAQWNELKKHHACLYMRFLYDLFGYPRYGVSSTGATSPINAPLLGDAIRGALFIDMMPTTNEKKLPRTEVVTIDYIKQQKQLKRIGDRGEAIVIAMERRRLTEAKRGDLANKIVYIAEKNDRAGYDILSFDEDGTERPIEVKATSGKTLDRGFYITANEIERTSRMENYYIYFVFSVMSKNPRVFPVKKPLLSGGNFDMNPIVYHVRLVNY